MTDTTKEPLANSAQHFDFGDQAIDDIQQPFRDTVKRFTTRKSQIVVSGGSIYPTLQDEDGLGLYGGALAIVSTIIGGGIVGLPYAMFVLGLTLGIPLNAFVCIVTFYSGLCYLALRDLIPGKPNSLYEIGYMLQGRKSIFLVAVTQAINSFGLMMIYFIVFSDTAAQLVGGFTGTILGEVWYSSRWFYVICLGVGLAPVVVKKDLAELELLSIMLGIAILIFLVLTIVCLLNPNFPATGPTWNEILYPELEFVTISKFCTIMVAYAYQQNVFPVYDALKDQSKKGYAASSGRALIFSIVVYYTVAILGILLFGANIKSSVLLNFGDPIYYNPKTGKPFIYCNIIQITFMIVLLCHIPFIFYGGKEGLCIIVDEYKRKSISNVLWNKLQANEDFRNES